MNIRHKNLLIPILLAVVVLFGALLRFEAVLGTEVDAPFRADAGKYVQYAYNLKYFGTYTYSQDAMRGEVAKLKPDAMATPGYPLFLALLIDPTVSKSSYYRILLTQAALSTVTILLAYFLFAALAGPAAGLATAALTALSPHLINMNVYVLSETLACFFLIASLLCLAHRKTLDTPWLLFLCGVLLAAATLTRPWTQAFVLVLAGYLLVVRVPLRRALLVVAGFGLLFAPWVLRNLLNVDLSSDPSLLVASIYHGSFPDMMFEGRPETLGFPYRFDPRAGEVSSSLSALGRAILEKFRSEPWAYAQWYLFGKTAAVFSWSMLGGIGDAFVYPVFRTPFESEWYFRQVHGFMHFIHNGVMTLSLIACGLVWTPARRLPFSQHGIFLARTFSLLVLYFVATNIVLAPFSRYSVPLRPVMYGMAIVGVITLAAWLKPVWGRLPDLFGRK
jgi:4-amino-4-deoxy-L-arabinose transferase-like glycosyltransferase